MDLKVDLSLTSLSPASCGQFSWFWPIGKKQGRRLNKAMIMIGPDMGTKLLWLQLHEVEAFEAKASASASWFQKLKASASVS